MKERPLEYWEKYFIDHRADELAILVMESLRILLCRGSMTATDVHHIPVKNPSVRGGLMKLLKRMGVVEKTGLAFGDTKQSHGHTMFVWTLTNSQRAREIQNLGIRVVLPEHKTEMKQMELL